MYVFDQMKLVEQRGLGFQTIKDLPVKFGLPLPLVSYEEPYMVFTFPRSGEALKSISGSAQLNQLNSDELKGYDFIRVKERITRKEYEDYFAFDKKKAERHLTHMTDLELIVRKGSGRGTYYEMIAT